MMELREDLGLSEDLLSRLCIPHQRWGQHLDCDRLTCELVGTQVPLAGVIGTQKMFDLIVSADGISRV